MTPGKIRVKLVSEAAEYVSVSHVVQRDLTIRELVEVMLPVVGSDAARLQQMIRVGTISTGEYRYRWEGMEVPADELAALLDSFPRADPSRPFRAENCFLVRFRHGQEVLDLPREAAERRVIFAKRSFWDGLMDLAADLRYSGFSHAEKADVFTLELDAASWQKLSAQLPTLKPRSAAERLERLRPEQVDWLVRR
jgi:hypothetical protein